MYCVKYHAKKRVENPEKFTMKNSKPVMKEKWPDCGTGIYKMYKIDTA